MAGWLLVGLGTLAYMAGGPSLCGSGGIEAPLWGVPFFGASFCALRANSEHLGGIDRTIRAATLVLAGVASIYATWETIHEFRAQPPAVDYTPPAIGTADRSTASRLFRGARCSD